MMAKCFIINNGLSKQRIANSEQVSSGNITNKPFPPLADHGPFHTSVLFYCPEVVLQCTIHPSVPKQDVQ